MHGIDRGGRIGVAAARHAGADRAIFFIDADAPFIDGFAVRNALVAIAGHRQPGVGKTPAERGVLLAVVHMAEDLLAVDGAAGEELGDILISRPVHGNAEIVAVLGLELLLVLRVVEPVVTEPVEVGELLVGELVEFAVRRGGEGLADEVVDVEGRRGDVLAFAGHPIRQVAHLLVAPVRSDQIAIVDPAVIDVLTRLHLGLNLLDDVAFLDDVVRHLDAGDLSKRLGQRLGLIFVGGDRFRNHLDVHALEGLGRFHEPFHLLHLRLFRE